MHYVRTALLMIGMVGGMALQAQGPKKEMIIRTKALSEEQVFHLKTKLSSVNGLHFCGYQPDARCLMMQYDPQLVKQPEMIVRLIKNTEQVGAMKVIRNVTIYEVLDGSIDANRAIAADQSGH